MNLCTEYHGRSEDRLTDILKMLASRDWISSNLDELPPLKIVESKEYDPLAGQRDIRFYPSASATSTASASQEQSLMDEGEILEHSKEGEVLEVDLSREEEELLLKSPPPTKASSPKRSPRLQKRAELKRKPRNDDRVDNSSSSSDKKYRRSGVDDSVDNSSSTSRQKEDQQKSRSRQSEVDDRVDNPSSSLGQSKSSRAKFSITTKESGRQVHITTKSELQKDIVLEVKEAVKEKRVRHRKCSVKGCNKPNTFAKAHAFNYHIPPVFRELLPAAETDILRSRTMALKQVARWLQVIPASLEELMKFVEQQHMLSVMDNVSINPRQEEMMARMCDYNNLPIPEKFTI
ncbi:hypothetical protein KUTeg_016845 [Tegillarca granosa]|uniref:Uncharacterized protein n=1 Tax=Tegillarca granosa TaxID=220873 RepID=A0ABQ9ESD0_TEGGR|nr:hypothetical protein KUTeg_016845 [Tegillarca granosa]